MNRKITLLTVLLSACLCTTAQENNPLINSANVIQSGIKLYDAGHYKEAMKEFEQVKPGDTNYVWALYEMTLVCMADSQYDRGIRISEEALALPTERERCPDLLSQYGSLLDYANQQERSLQVFDSAIALYPAHIVLYVNKGTTLIRMKKYKEAEKVFQQALLINPYSTSSHFKLGICAAGQGNIVPAYMSLVASLIMEPEGKFSRNAITLLDNIAKSKDDIVELVGKRKEEPSENFRMIEQIVLSKIALDKNYKSIIELDDPISRQMQVIFEKLSYDESDNDFYMQFYVPFYRNMFDEKKFEYLVNHAFSGVDIKAIKEFNKKKKKDIQAFVNDAVQYFNQIRMTRELKLAKRNTNGACYYYKDGELIGKGISKNNGDLLVGPWEFYYAGGNKKAAGLYNDKGEREGPWTYYYFNGQVKGQEQYRNGKQEGPETYYHDQGVVSSRATYKNGEADGEHTTYYKQGAIRVVQHFSNGKLNGVRKTYYESGLLKSVETYTNDKRSGPFQTFHANGQMESEGNYVDDEMSGPYKAWYDDGGLSMEAQYEKDKPAGVLKRYHQNGKLKNVETYANGTLEGEYSAWHDNGQLNTKYINKKGKVNGDVPYYDRDGKLFSTLTFDGDIVKTSRYFDKSGKQISISETSRGRLELAGYRPDGTKRMVTPYNAKGETDGVQTYYYGSGKTKETNTYANGELNGESVAYHPNGQKSAAIKYVAGKKDGYYTSWFAHGAKEEEGWYKEDNLEGEWLRYNEMGDLIARTPFLHGDLHGIKTTYWPNGKKESDHLYDMDNLVEVTEYDTTGKVVNHVKLKNGNGKIVYRYANGKLYSEGNYIQGNIEGAYKTYYFDGSLQAVQYFKKGLLDSVYRSYYYGGKPASEGLYKLNEKNGTWKYYRPDGSLSYTEDYKAGRLHGKRIYYYKNGKADTEIPFEYGEKRGFYKKFNQEGTLIIQMRYEDEIIAAYNYLGKNGELVPEIPLVQGNGKVNALYPNGQVSLSTEYADGQQNGPYKLYHGNGKLQLENTEVYGKSEGPLKEYYPDGTLRSVYNYLHDNAHGPYKEYNAKGIVTEEGAYYNGIIHGEVRYYDDNGKVKQVRSYYYGQLLSVK